VRNQRANLELGETRNPSQIKTNRYSIPLLEERKTRIGSQRSSATTAAKRECRGKEKDSPRPHHTAAAAIIANGDVINEHSSFHSEFGQMYDRSDNTEYKTCNMVVTKTPGATSTHGVNFGLPDTTTSIQPVKFTNVAFDTGATGSIVTNDAILANVSNCRATE
jgi:hypothetical protein